MHPQWHAIQEALLPADKRRTAGSASAGTKEELPEIPLPQMWQDDEFWMPLMFARRFFVGRADFAAENGNNNKMVRWWFGAVPETEV